MINIETGLSYDDVLLKPRKSLLSRSQVDTSSDLSNDVILKIPFIASNMDTVCGATMAETMGDLGALGIVHRFMSMKDQCEAMHQLSDQEHRAASVGVKDRERIAALQAAGANILCIDIANGFSDAVADTIDLIGQIYSSSKSPTIIAGNVATYEGAKFLQDSGADVVKCGIGPSPVCSTRVVTGSGYPTMSGLAECVEGADHVIADGGIKTSGDIVKALAVGAKAVMMGSMFAGTEETPGMVIIQKGKQYKKYRGMASADAQNDWNEAKGPNTTVEGVSRLVDYKGPVAPIIKELVDGLKSGMSYQSAKTLVQLRSNAKFIRITHSGLKESVPYGFYAES